MTKIIVVIHNPYPEHRYSFTCTKCGDHNTALPFHNKGKVIVNCGACFHEQYI